MRKSIILLFAGLLMFGFTSGAKASSIASSLPVANYSDSGNYDGQTSQSLFNGGRWNSGTWGTQWVQVDLGGPQSIASIEFIIDQSPSGLTSINVYTSDSYIGNNWNGLSPMAIFNQFTNYGEKYALTFTPVTNSYLEIVANGGPSWTALNDVRVYSSVDPAPVPEPSSMILGAISMAAMGLRKRNKKSKA